MEINLVNDSLEKKPLNVHSMLFFFFLVAPTLGSFPTAFEA
jgi:hypothetical protein